MKKQSFVILEVLIALSLVLLVITPLLISPIRFYQFEMNKFKELEKERIAELSFLEIKAKLLNHQITWEQIPPKDHTSAFFSLPNTDLFIPGKKPVSVTRTFRLKCVQEKQGSQDEIYKLLVVELCFNHPLSFDQKSPSYTYRFRTIARLMQTEMNDGNSKNKYNLKKS